MKPKLLLLFFFIALIKSYATATFLNERDEFSIVKVITKGVKTILVQLQYITDSSIHVMPGTNKES